MKLVSAREAARIVKDGATLAISGFGGFGHAEAITAALEDRFLGDGAPRDLMLICSASVGDRKSRGLSHFGNEGMVRRVIAGGWRGAPRLGALANDNKIEAYVWPQGVISQLFRASASRQPGLLTRIGLQTFIDPRFDGGRLNAKTTEELVQLMVVNGQEWLFYPAQSIDVAIIRGTTADENGNITSEEEAFHQDMLSMAAAAHNAGGVVIAQVKRIAKAGTLHPNMIRVPGMLVDYVVVAERADQHGVSFGEDDNPAYTGAVRLPHAAWTPAPLDAMKVIQRRAFLEMRDHAAPVVNLGIGIPAGIGRIAHEEGKRDVILTLESGVIGGIPADGLSFGAALNPEAIIDQASQFDLYDGGAIDFAFLGMAQLDTRGNVNVSRFGSQIIGVGGFMNISQSAKHVAFAGAFTAGGTDIRVENGKLRIAREGGIRKIVDEVEHLSFNGADAERHRRPVVYITERAVFIMRNGALTVTEVAPGIDLKADVLALVPDGVKVAPDLRLMDPRIFAGPALHSQEADA